MAEPAGVFWIAHSFQARSAPDVKAFLAESRLRPAWVSTVHAVGHFDRSGFGAIGIPPESTTYSWPERAFSDHRILHFAIRSILLGETEIALVLTPSAAAILTSHLAVGRRNIFPLASIGACSAFNLGELPLLDQLAVSLSAHAASEALPNALVIDGIKRPVKKGSPLENAVWVNNVVPESGLAGCCSIVDTLTASGRKRGLALDVEPGSLALYTTLERM